MSISRVGKLYINGSIWRLAIVLVVVKRFTAVFELNCSPDIKKCNVTNQLYHLRSHQCLRIGDSNGRFCGSNMVFSPLTSCRIEGECECDYENNERHLVYHAATDQCYPIYSQGPYDDGYVVSISPNGRILSCERNICVEEKMRAGTERDSIVTYKNQCYTLCTELNEPGCKGKLKFWRNQMHPSCRAPRNYDRRMDLYLPAPCRPGSHKTYDGKCRPSVSFPPTQPAGGAEDEDTDIDLL